MGIMPYLFVAIFVAVGTGMAVRIVWGLLTGGPRAKDRPGAPFLYDRLYYLMFLVALVGWWIAMLSFFGSTTRAAPSGFLIGWGILAIGMGSLFLFRQKMMVDGARYLATHGFPLFRIFHAMQAGQFDRQPAFMRKLVAVVFLITGVGVLVFNIGQINQVPGDVEAGAVAIATMRLPF